MNFLNINTKKRKSKRNKKKALFLNYKTTLPKVNNIKLKNLKFQLKM